MNLEKLRAHEDRVTIIVNNWPRIEQLIALRYLRTLLGVAIENTGPEIIREYTKELKADAG